MAPQKMPYNFNFSFALVVAAVAAVSSHFTLFLIIYFKFRQTVLLLLLYPSTIHPLQLPPFKFKVLAVVAAAVVAERSVAWSI